MIVGSGAGGGVIAGELSAAGKQVCVLEMGGYHDESEFNGLELWAYQNLFLNQGPFPTAEGQVSSRPAARSAAAPCSTGPTACAPPTASARSGRRARPRGPRRPRLRRAHGRGLGAHLRHRRVQRPERPPQPAQGGLRGARLRLADGHPQHRPRRPTTRSPPATWASATSPGSKRSTQKTYLADAAGRGADFVVHCRVERILHRGRPRRRGRGDLRRPRRPHRPGRPSARRRSSSPAARSSRRRCCCAPGSAARRPATTCASTRPRRSSASTTRRRTRGGDRRRPASRTSSRTSTRATASCSSARSTRPGLTAAATPWRSGADHKRAMSKFAHGAGLPQPDPRPRPRPGDDRRRRASGRPLPAHRRARHRAPAPRARGADPPARGRRRRRRCRR